LCSLRSTISTATIAVLVSILAVPQRVSASKPRLRLERVDASRCQAEGLVRTYVAELELEGTLRFRSPLEYRLEQEGKIVAQRPLRATTFVEQKEPLHLALVIERGSAYADDLDQIKQATATFVDALPDRTQITVLAYAREVEQALTKGTPGQTREAIERLTADTSAVDLALIDALRAGLHSLSRATPDERRVLVVISDGIDSTLEWDRFRGTGDRARAAGVPIFPLAYSPSDERGPLLNLGELAKRSGGTLRWARQAVELDRAFDQLAREIKEEQILTFHVASCPGRKSLQVTAGGLYSNAITADTGTIAASDRPLSGRSVLRFVLLGILLLLAAAVLALATRWVFRGFMPKRAGRRRTPARPPGRNPEDDP